MKDVTSKLLPGTLSRLETDFMRAPGVLLALWLGFQVVQYGITWALEGLKSGSNSNSLGILFFSAVEYALGIILYAVFTALILLVIRSLEEVGVPRVDDALRRIGSRLLRLFLVQVVTTLIVAAGFICFVIPGIYAVLLFTFTVQTVIDAERPLTISETLRKAADLVRPYLWDIFILGLTLIVIALIPIGVLTFMSAKPITETIKYSSAPIQSLFQLISALIYTRIYLILRKRQQSDPEQLELV